MALKQRAVEAVERAEKEIASLASEAAAQQDYAQASVLLVLAQRLRDTVRPLLTPTADPGRSNGSVAGFSPAESVPARSRNGSAPVRKSAETGYPRFKREGDNLVKIGWSKSDRSTYEHRSPRSVLARLVERVAQAGAGGRRFTTEDVLPLHDPHGEEMPSYQAYLCLAWLVAMGALERHGRQGYTIQSSVNLEQVVDEAWGGLPAR